MPQRDSEFATTRAVASWPGLEVEIVHRRPTEEFEQVSISLQAVPSFDAFARFVETAGPFEFWQRAVALAWMPWLETARLMMQSWAAIAAPRQFAPANADDVAEESHA